MSTTPTENATGSHEGGPGCDTDAINSLLRGELSAIETYDQALAKFDKNPDLRAELSRVQREHLDSASTLRDIVTRYGGTPSDRSGSWGTFASAVTGAAKVLGPETVLSALKQGEQHGLNDYERTLDNDKVADECKALIRTTLMPRCREHLATLDRIQAMV